MVKECTMESLEKDCCIFCHSNKDDLDKLGKMHRSRGITVHYFCMLFASGLVQNGRSVKSGIMGFLHSDIMKEAKRASRLRCTYCKTIGATIGCVASRCRVVFHLPCGLKNNALNQYMDEFRSYCEAHRPQQEMPNKSDAVQQNVLNSVCIMCMNQIEMRPSNTVLYTPCCKNSWFHRDCLQRHAISSGLHFFKCPLCNDKDLFQKEMLKFGIYIPDQDAAWEREPNAFQDLLVRHSQCDVKCICPYGQKYKKESSKWDLMLCDWCGSSGTHIACSKLKSALDPWVCKECHQICGSDMKKPEEKANKSCHQAAVEQRKCQRSVHRAESCSKKQYYSPTSAVTDEQRSTKWSQSHRKSSVGRSNRRRKNSQVCDYTEEAESETSGVSGVRTQQFYAMRVRGSNGLRQHTQHDDHSSRQHQNFVSRHLVTSVFEGEEPGPSIAYQWFAENDGNACGPARSHPPLQDRTIPRWYRNLMAEDILTGKNLGTKYREQYQDLCSVFQSTSN